ncbi:MAG: DUF1573 domain-containing protein, partial [Muribaculaceae bacterium]
MNAIQSMAVFLLLLLTTNVAARAGDALTISSSEAAPGEAMQIDVSLTNSDTVSALQLSIPVGDNLEYMNGSATLNPDRIDDHGIMASQSNGVLTVVVYTVGLKPLKGDSGLLFSLNMKSGNNPGHFSLEPSELILTDVEGNTLEASATAGTAGVIASRSEYNSYSIDYGKVPLQSSYTKNITVTNSGTAELVISDIVLSDASLSTTITMPYTIAEGKTATLPVVYTPVNRGAANYTMRVISNTTTARNTIEIAAAPYAVNELHVVGTSGISDSEVEIALSVNNQDPLCGFQ